MKNLYSKTILSVLVMLVFSTIGFAQTTAFNYQGSLNSGGSPASGSHDFEFALFDAPVGGSQLGSTLTQNSVAVTNGIFAVSLDFGSQFPGANRFLEIRVRQTGGGAFTPLLPRQPVNSTPYAIKSVNADNATNATNATTATTATNATNAVNATNAANFTGNLSGDVTGTQGATTVARLQSRNVAGTAPLDGQVLKFNSTTNQWLPDTDIVGTGGGGGTITGVTPGTGLTGGGATGNVTLGIANGGVGTAQLADNNVTDAKINTVSGGKVTGAVSNALQLGGVEANQYVVTTDSRMTDARTPTAGSANYVQNTTVQQAASSFNISGTGTANILNAATRYDIGGNRVLSVAGSDNVFAGVGAGANNTGFFNSFFGRNAGLANTTGFENSFFGREAGAANMDGNANSFFGREAGWRNTTGASNSFFGSFAGHFNTGSNNSFFGRSAGDTNTTGSSNTIIGHDADVDSGNLSFATAIGAGARVTTNNRVVLGRTADTVEIPGSLSLIGTLNVIGALNASGSGLTNLNASNITSGTLSNARLGVVPIANGGTGSATQNFVDLTNAQTIGGNKTFSGTLSANAVNSTTQYNIGGNSVLSVAGTDNVFAGVNAGAANTGANNSFFGRNAGQANIGGTQNAFFGTVAGRSNTTGATNSFFGNAAGFSNTEGGSNSFFGSSAGQANIGGSFNSFFGLNAGRSNTAGNFNSFFGREAGVNNTGTANSFFGTGAGLSNAGGSNNTIIGDGANVGSGTLTFATAIGSGALVSANNRIQLGRAGSDTVSIGAFAAATAINLCISGTVLATCSSSQRYKESIQPLTSGLNLIQRLRPVTFDWKERREPDLGLIAEEVAEIEPLLVTRNPDGVIEGVKYDQISVVLINAVNEQQRQIKAQQKLIDGLKKLVCSQNPQAEVCKDEK